MRRHPASTCGVRTACRGWPNMFAILRERASGRWVAECARGKIKAKADRLKPVLLRSGPAAWRCFACTIWAARRHLGISELTWADWAEEIRGRVGRELTRSGLFPPSKYFRETTE